MAVGGAPDRGESPVVSDSSEPGDVTFTNGPESPFVVDAIDAMLRDDLTAARDALLRAADVAGWRAVAHRIDVAGRALTLDAGYTPDTVPEELDLVPEVIATTLRRTDADVPELLGRWCEPDTQTTATSPSVEAVWPSLAMLAWLVDQAGFPAEVVV